MSYKVIDLPQGTPEWLNLRYDYVTASQTPILFDLSPYQTRLGLFEEKVMRIETQDNRGKEVLFARGHSAEAAGRIFMQEQRGLDLQPAVLVSIEHPYLMASLDGFCEKTKAIFEAKFVGADTLKAVRDGNPPPHHLCQIQAALLVSGAEKCFYFVTDPSGDSHLAEVLPDLAYQDAIASAAKAFMDNVAKGTPPEPSERDFHVVDNEPLFEKYAYIDAQIKALEEVKESFRQNILEKYKDHKRVRGSSITVVKSIKRGSIEYAKIPVLKGLDLEKYRKASTEVVTIRVEKPKSLKGVA